MNQKSKSKLFNNKDLSIESKEIFFLNEINYSQSSEKGLKEKNNKDNKKTKYFPIISCEPLKEIPSIYLETKNNVNKKDTNIDKNTNKINTNNKEYKNNILNLKRRIRIKTKKDSDKMNNNINNKNKIKLSNEQENISDKENIPQNKNDKIYTYKNNNNKNHYLNRRIINKKKVIENEDKQSTDYITHSLSVDNYIKLNNKSLMKFQKDLENSQIFDENFIKGIKNVKRKKELLKAIEKYKRYKSLGRLRINNNNFFNNSFTHGFGGKNKDNNNERINTFDKTNYKIIEEENENDSESEITLKNSKINEVNKIKIKNILNLKQLNNSILNRNNYIKLNKNIKNLNDFFNNDKTKDFIRNIRERIKQKNNNTNQNLNKNANTHTSTITNLKPNEVLVRQILREERYIIDENGNERLLEVNQSFLPKKINIKKLEYMNQLNLRTKSKSKSIDIDDEIIKKERYRDNNRKILITNKSLAKMKSQNLIQEKNKRSFINMSSYNNNTINGHAISTIKYKERPILLSKHQNKIDKINLIKWNEIKNFRNSFLHRNQEQEKKHTIVINNNNHTYHEISSFSGRKQEVNKRPTKKVYNNKSYNINEKRLLNNNSYQQIKYHKSNNFVLNDYRTNRNVSSSDFYNSNFENNERIFQSDCNYDTERHHKNYSIHEIIEINNKKKQLNTKKRRCFIRPFEECKNSNSNGIYITTSPNYNIKSDTFHTHADSIRSQYNIYKKNKIINRINPIYISNNSVRNSNIRERIKTSIY